MKQFNFDTAIYKILNESLFDDEDDELLSDEINLDKLFITKEYILEEFNTLYAESNKIVGKKYGCWKPHTFSDIKEKTYGSTKYYILDTIQERASYVSMPKIKHYMGPIIIIGTQKLVNFMEDYNVIIHTPIIYADDNNDQIWSKTYIYENVTLSYAYIDNMSFLAKQDKNARELPYLYFNNVKVVQQAFENLLSLPYDIIKPYEIYCNKGLGITELNIHTYQALKITIQNDPTLKKFNAIYENATWQYDGKIVLQNCKSLRDVDIEEKSDMITLSKLKIDKCPNINPKTLMLPNHNTRNYNIQMLNDLDRLRTVSFRGEVVRYFYFVWHKDYKNKWYDSKPYLNMYKKKGE